MPDVNSIVDRSIKFIIQSMVSIILLSTEIFAQNVVSNSDWITIINDKCIYDNNNHAAFTALTEWKGKHLLAFREAGSHRSTPTDNGVIRIMEETADGWKLQHSFSMEGVDLRDPYMIEWNNRLFLYTCSSIDYYAELSKRDWTELNSVIYDVSYNPSIWKKRIYRGVMYGIGNAGKRWPRLMTSSDGINWQSIVEFKIGGDASEADMVFIGDSMFVCIRIDTPVGSNSMWGESVFPYKEFQWSLMDVSIASPEMIVCSNHTILLSGREYDYHRQDGKDSIYVSLLALDTDGKVKRRYIVERDGYDKGYPSFSKGSQGQYYMSYYAGEKKTSVRMLTFKIKDEELK